MLLVSSYELLTSASADIQRMHLNNTRMSSQVTNQAINLVYQCRLSMIAIYGPMTYTAMLLMRPRANPLFGQVGQCWALEIETFWTL